MTLQELRYLIALAREKHFRKAADASFVSQPTLSIAINKIEKELGVILFERDKNNVRLTKTGDAILERAKRIMHEMTEIKAIASQDMRQPAQLKIGVIYTVGPYLLPNLIAIFKQNSVKLPIEIHEDYTENLRPKLLNGELDVLFISLPFSGSGIETRTFYKESFVVLMPKDHALTKFKTIPEKVLSEYNILMLGEGHCFREQVIASCPLCFSNIAKNNWHTVQGGSLETIRHMVASGMGLTILPERAARYNPYAKMLVVRPLDGALKSRIVALAYRKSYPYPKAIEMLIQAKKSLKI